MSCLQFQIHQALTGGSEVLIQLLILMCELMNREEVKVSYCVECCGHVSAFLLPLCNEPASQQFE